MRNHRIQISALLIFAMLWGLFLSGCSEKTSKETAEIYALDTIVNITAYGENSTNAIENAKAEIIRLEKLFSVTREGSDISRINSAKGESVRVSEETFELIAAAVDAAELTQGRFDITLCGVLKLWGFTEENYRVPSKEEISRELEKTGYEKIALSSPDEVLVPDGTKIDLGGIAKGYIGDRLAEVMKSAGCEYGVISLGGNVRTFGEKEQGESFVVGIQHPQSGGYFATLQTGEASVITSGAYQRNFTENGKTYHHILNSETGYPAESDIESVTVTGADGALCDALSTALFAGGSSYAEKLQEELGNFEYVILLKDGDVLVCDGLKGKFSLSADYQNLNIRYI